MISPGCDISLWLPDEDNSIDDIDENFNDSDEINSEVEAELYSKLHYEESSFDNTMLSLDKSDHSNSDNYFCSDTSFANNSLEYMKKNHLHPLQKKNIIPHPENNTKVNNDSSISVTLSSSEKRRVVVERSKTQGNIRLNKLKTKKDKGKSKSFISQEHCKANKKKVNKFGSHSNLKNNRDPENRVKASEEIDNSSEESVVFVESDDDIGLDLMTNISNNDSEDSLEDSDIVCLDSVGSLSGSMLNEDDSESEMMNEASPKSCNSISNQASNSLVTTKKADLWRLDHEDIYSHVKKNFRYHQNRSMNVICHNCQEKGHLSKSCPNPRKLIHCYLCGGEGHIAVRCANKICEKCFRSGHSAKYCAVVPKNISCSLCRMKGHNFMRCPDLWRRYHLTTSMTGIVKGKRENQSKIRYCYNCGAKGHLGHECSKSRMQHYIAPILPFIVSYKDPKEIFDKITSKKRKTGKKQKVICDTSEAKDYHLNHYNSMPPNQKFVDGQFMPLNQNFLNGQFVLPNQNFPFGHHSQNFVDGPFLSSNQNFLDGHFVIPNKNLADRQFVHPKKTKKTKYLSKLLVRFDQPYIPRPSVQYGEMMNEIKKKTVGQNPDKKKKCKKRCKKAKKLSDAKIRLRFNGQSKT